MARVTMARTARRARKIVEIVAATARATMARAAGLVRWTAVTVVAMVLATMGKPPRHARIAGTAGMACAPAAKTRAPAKATAVAHVVAMARAKHPPKAIATVSKIVPEHVSFAATVCATPEKPRAAAPVIVLEVVAAMQCANPARMLVPVRAIAPDPVVVTDSATPTKTRVPAPAIAPTIPTAVRRVNAVVLAAPATAMLLA